MKNAKLLRIIVLLVFAVLLVYVIFPNPSFPDPPSGAVQSNEPADTETPLRRAYFVDLTRAQVINHYKNQFSTPPFLRFNYPPEEAQTIIRDQTRSTYLEEITHPFRESVFINGFEPKVAKDEIIIDGVHYDQKIIIRYVPSNMFVRIIVVIFTGILAFILVGEVQIEIIKWLEFVKKFRFKDL